MTDGIRNDHTKHIVKTLKRMFPQLALDCTQRVRHGDFMIVGEYCFRTFGREMTTGEFERADWENKLADEINDWLFELNREASVPDGWGR
jgi:hypothetical protein